MGLVLQAFVNMAVAVGLVPVTGQTLPLVSMGGSSIFFTSMAAGMILSVSWGTKEEPTAGPEERSEPSGEEPEERSKGKGKRRKGKAGTDETEETAGSITANAVKINKQPEFEIND
jgi:hypothetical protein